MVVKVHVVVCVQVGFFETPIFSFSSACVAVCIAVSSRGLDSRLLYLTRWG
jgi:hypothetical protein